MTPQVVETNQLAKTFNMDGRAVEVLKGIDFSLRIGGSAAIVGPSGAGKSTLLHILGLLEAPSSGSYSFEGRDVRTFSDREKTHLRLNRIGFVFQFHHLLQEFTARENVMIPALMLGLSRIEAMKRADNLLEEIGLTDRASHRPGELSGGEQQRVALARALVNRPILLLADEPTGNLDQASAEHMRSILRNVVAANRAALLLVTHNLQLAQTADVILTMQGGMLEHSESAT